MKTESVMEHSQIKKNKHPQEERHPLMGILPKTALLSWLVTIVTMAVFVAVIVPSQKEAFVQNLESKARGVSVSLQKIAAGAVVTEDYSEVVDHCMVLLSRDETIKYLVLTRNDGFALIHTRDGWTNEQQGNTWHPAIRMTTHTIGWPEIIDEEVFQYSHPFDYSGIEWGWIHIGLSLHTYRESVAASYRRTGWVALVCILMGLCASIVYARRLVDPILRLRNTAQQVADGDLSARADVSSGDEVEALANAFNAMTQAVQDREAQVRSQSQQLASLVTDQALHAGELLEAAERITESSALTLGVQRVGVWLFNDHRSVIECIDQFDLGKRSHTRGASLGQKDHENYFAALDGERVLSISDAVADPQSACLAESYLLPLGVSSLMDAAIRMGNRVVGVVCNEHVGKCREWTLEEEQFAGSIADLFARALEARDRRAVQDELLEAKEAAEIASEAKSQFLANMSHEIRTPINGVMGMLQLLEMDDLSERQKRYISAALDSSDTLLTVIGDVLDFSKIEAGRLELDHTDFSLLDALDSAVRLFAGKAETQGVELSYAVAPGLPDKVVGDSNRLRQVLINLVGNAMKFTESGEVHLDARLLEVLGSHAIVSFSVRDTGPGIPPEQCETIFESFAQGDASMQRRHGGTGLGLAISRHLINLMGGEIQVESKVGEGSTFSFTARLELQNAAPRASKKRIVSARGLRILVVDDSETVRELVCQYARAWGCHVGQAANASDALNELRLAKDLNKPYGIALIDARMPGIDGIHLAGLLREEEKLQPLQLILLSGFSVPSLNSLREYGVECLVSKPIRPSELFDTIVTVTNGSEAAIISSPDETADTETIEAPSVRILLVEDNAINQEVARVMVEKLGYRCDLVANGYEAIKAAKRVCYDLVLMDCQMPGLDGYEATRQIRGWEARNGRTAFLPIVALTAHVLKGDREHCLEAGMNDYLGKPLQGQELAGMLRKWLSGKRSVAAQENGQVPTSSKVGAFPSADEEAQEAAVIERCSGNRELAAQLLHHFVAQTNEDIATMARAIAGGDAEGLAEAAHRLKGAAGNLAFDATLAAAAELEQKARVGKLDEAGRLISTLQAEAEQVAAMTILREANKL